GSQKISTPLFSIACAFLAQKYPGGIAPHRTLWKILYLPRLREMGGVHPVPSRSIPILARTVLPSSPCARLASGSTDSGLCSSIAQLSGALNETLRRRRETFLPP